jgi:serine/threonine protein kinase/tetratricopeptide (TPR) repeat protein
MTPERFRQIEQLYHAAREGTAEARAALLAQTDPELRREVELLLSQTAGGNFLDRPAFENAPGLLEDSTVTNLAAGACLGPYRIESKLGEGGMGEVFRAVDTRLGRAVAIKTSHERFSARFEREALSISSLNHPNICTLHDVGPNYFVMELVEGETVAARLKSGPLPVKTALRYASQIMAALVEAHGKGIVHRDLKPANIMIAKSGIKVLDFGLAKSGQDETVTASRMVMGTPAYMAPEQREGKPADARSDIYSFGCVLHEMLTGVRPASQRKRMPSRRLERIVSRCLEEDPGRRWQSAAVLERELAGVTATNPWRWVSAAAAALALFAWAYIYLHRAPRLTERDTLVLADFENKTGDPVFDETLRQGLSVELQESPFLSVISDQQVQRTLGLMGQPKDARLTPEVAQQICERTTSAAILEGSIASLGSQYVLGLRAKNCNTGNILDQEQVQAARKEDVLNSLSQIARKFRIRVGESLATVEKHSTPLAEATTPSLEALKAYSAAWKALASTGSAAAVPLFKRATEIDPKFAMAYGSLGRMYGDIGEAALSAENSGKAYGLRDRASDREKFFIAANYDVNVTGNLEKAQQTCELWEQTYPRDGRPHTHLAGMIYPVFGKYEKGVDEAKTAIELEPDFPVGYNVLAHSYMSLDRLGEAENILQRASGRKLETPDLLVTRYEIALLRGDNAGMEREAALSRRLSGAEDEISDKEAFVLAYSGRLQQARKMSRRALWETGPALWEALFGNAPEAKKSAMAVIELSKDRDVEYASAFALALSEDSSGSQTLADDLESRFGEDTSVRFSYMPALRALIAMNHGEPAKAIELLQAAVPCDLGTPRRRHGSFGTLYPAYVRGEAYLAAHQGAEAAAEFQKILDHRGIVVSDPIGALAHLQLGRALALSGDKTKAKTAYQDFLTLWKDADRDIPILRQAKAEYAALQ